ncbi:MAG TPA: CpXC domain-containing protein, partial [Anaerolineae bacterium]|nr:CpXC domain-containing protein [Anaerolineae bacterium]
MIWTPDNRGGRAPSESRGPATGPGGVQIRCPRCQTPFAAQIINVIDVQKHPQLKAALVAGLLNRAECPGCGAVSVLNVPLVYHDPDKELLLVLVPSELNLPAEQQQRLIGGLVQAIMSQVPADQRKGYFLRPQTILSMQRLVETILEADGVTREMLDEQRARLQLLEDLVRAKDDPAQIKALIDAHRARLDYAFMATLTATAQDAEAAGDAASADQLLALRDTLLQDPALAARMPQPFAPDTTIDDAIERLELLADDEEALAAMAILNRPAFDYGFFQELTGRAERARAAGDVARAERLTALRDALLQQIDRQDKALQAAQQHHLRLIEEILANPDQQAAIGEHLEEIDTLFLSVLGGAIEKARREGNIERSARLDGLRRAILDLLAESMPPEVRLINHLLSLEAPDARRAVLAESAGLLSGDLEHLVQDLIDEVQGQGRTETARRLQAILAEIRQARTASSAAR